MVCGNKFCIYYENQACLLDSITLDSIGMCASCVYINISEIDLAARRMILRKKLQKQRFD
nr:hypothetical protein [bacterium]